MKPRVVLVEPASQGNVGATARVIRNFDLGELVLVRPDVSIGEEARRRACASERVLEGARVTPSVAAALEGCTLAVGFTARSGLHRGRLRSLEEGAIRVASEVRADRMVGLVFGPERTGLSNQDLDHCNLQVTIPTGGLRSLNLSHAVAIAGYAILAALRSGAPPPPQHEPVPLQDVENLYEHAERLLRDVGFLDAGDQNSILHALRQMVARSNPSIRDVKILRGILSRLESRVAGSVT